MKEKDVTQRRKALRNIATELETIYSNPDFKLSMDVNRKVKLDIEKVRPLMERANSLLAQAKNIYEKYVDDPNPDTATEEILRKILPNPLMVLGKVDRLNKTLERSAGTEETN